MLITKDMLNVSTKMPGHKSIQSHVPCQYCGSEENQLNACPLVTICPICKTKNHNLLYICPLLKILQTLKKEL